ncbi:MAG: nucleotidyltransferase domain-containing protein [Desulfobacterales bacterium]|nr:MAG: nucleotidyltransferase domain-containing protein [Desulfobacterales bacterium]
MIKYGRLPENILQLLPEAVSYLRSHPSILFAYLFGGLAKGKLQPLSDVDIAVYLRHGGNFAENKLDILGNLMAILQTDEIDLVVLNTAELALAMSILKTKKLVVDKAPHRRQIFESLTMRKFFDFSIKESGLLRRRYLLG